MIFGNAKCLQNYKNQVPAAIYDCLEKMATFDFTGVKDGKYQINGYDMSVESTMTELSSNRKLEGHKKFIDVVYEVDAEEEIIGCRFLLSAGKEAESYPERDLYFFESEGEESKILLHTGDFAICFPFDLHRPLCQGTKGAKQIRKAVLKFPMNQL